MIHQLIEHIAGGARADLAYPQRNVHIVEAVYDERNDIVSAFDADVPMKRAGKLGELGMVCAECEAIRLVPRLLILSPERPED